MGVFGWYCWSSSTTNKPGVFTALALSRHTVRGMAAPRAPVGARCLLCVRVPSCCRHLVRSQCAAWLRPAHQLVRDVPVRARLLAVADTWSRVGSPHQPLAAICSQALRQRACSAQLTQQVPDGAFGPHTLAAGNIGARMAMLVQRTPSASPLAGVPVPTGWLALFLSDMH